MIGMSLGKLRQEVTTLHHPTHPGRLGRKKIGTCPVKLGVLVKVLAC